MGGEAQRRRAKNVLKARETKSGRLTTLPPPPNELQAGRKGKKSASNDMPRSLQKMLRLKDALANKSKKRAPVSSVKQAASPHAPGGLRGGAAAAAPQQASLPARQEPASAAAGDSSQQEGRPAEATAPRPEENSSAQSQPEAGPAAAAAQQGPAAKGKQRAAAAAPPAQGGMKQRKKDFLKRRKLRRKGRPGAAGGAEDGDDDLEARLLHDAHKPKFGEQAMAPLKVNLKRKHFVPDESRGRSSKRCTAIFEQQMAAAAQAAGGRQQGGAERVAQPGAAAQRAKRQKVVAGSTAPQQTKQQARDGANRRPAVQAGLQAAVINAYRDMRREEGGKGATMQTLKALVKRDASRAAAGAAMQQGE